MSYHADLEALADLVDRMSAFDRRAEHLARQLGTQQRELAGAWTGTAARAQSEAHERWTRSHAEQRDALRRLTGFVRTAHGNYSAATAANVRMWS